MAIRLFPANYIFLDESTAVPVAGGSVEFDESGTSTNKNVNDKDGVSLGHTLALDSEGRFTNDPFNIDTGLYRVTVKDSDSNVVTGWPRDKVQGVTTATDVNYVSDHTGAVTQTTQNTLRSRPRSIFELMTTTQIADVEAGTVLVDVTTPLQNALDAQYPYFMPPGVYRTTAELVYSDFSSLTGAAMYNGARDSTGDAYDATIHTVIFYDGAGGANSAAVRLSKLAVGTRFADITPPGTDDLFNVTFKQITVDGNAKAEFGVYLYRLSDNVIGPAAAMNCKEAGMLILGSFNNEFNNLICFSNEKNGLEVGRNRFDAAMDTERQIHANTFIDPLARFNGTAETYDEGVVDDEGHGLFFMLDRGNVIIRPGSENNDGAGFYLETAGSFILGGPNKFIGGFTEGNMSDVVADARGTHAWNALIFYTSDMRHWEFDSTYFSNSNSQDIKISNTSTPSNWEAFLTFRNCFFKSTGQIEIDSDTPDYRVTNCSPAPSYTDKRPGIEEVSADGALDIVSPITEFTTSSEQVDVTIAVTGVSEGFEKTLVMVDDGGFDVVVTPASLEPGLTTITLNSNGDLCKIQMLNSKWHVTAAQGVVLA